MYYENTKSYKNLNHNRWVLFKTSKASDRGALLELNTI